MSDKAPPELQPEFPARSRALPRERPMGGRELYKQAVRNFLEREIAEGRGHQHRLARRRGRAQWDRASDIKWMVLPSIIRRRWEAESRRLWPRWGDDPTVRLDPLDVFCSPDEIYYVRGTPRGRDNMKMAPNPGWSEDFIRERYQQVYDRLDELPQYMLPDNNNVDDDDGEPPANLRSFPVVSQNLFIVEADKIDYARGWEPPDGHLLKDAPQYTSAHDNGYKQHEPGHVHHRNDTRMLHTISGMEGSRGQWKWHKQLGEGTFGKAMLYRWSDQFGRTIERVVVKSDKRESQQRERSLLRILHETGADNNYIVKYLGEDSHGNQLGRTFLEYAPYGSLHELYAEYMNAGLVIPEAFMWYMLRCLAEAALLLERPVPPEKPSMFHFDIKPSNILLSTADDSHTSSHWHQNYPRVQLADICGVAVYADQGGEQEGTYRGCGTKWWQPWELQVHNDQVEFNKWRSSNRKTPSELKKTLRPPQKAFPLDLPNRIRTSIWQIGLVLYVGMRTTPSSRIDHDLMFISESLADEATLSVENRIRQRDYIIRAARRDYPRRHLRRFRTLTEARKARFVGDVLEKVLAPFWPKWSSSDQRRRRRRRRAAAAAALNPFADPALDAIMLRSMPNFPHPSYPPRTQLRPHYSARLVETVFRCLEPLPADRPTPRQLLDEARDACDGDLKRWWPGDQLVQPLGMDPLDEPAEVRPGPGPWVGDAGGGPPESGMQRPRGVMLPVDKYPIGSAVLNDQFAADPGPGGYGFTP